MSIQIQEIKTIVQAEEDFGHEMRVAHIFDNACGLLCDQQCDARVETPQHGLTYIDPATGKHRQFDFRCRIVRSYEQYPNGTKGSCVLLAVECKNLHESSPLIVCGRFRSPDEAFHTFVESRSSSHVSFAPITKKVDGFQSYYPPDEFVGKSLLRLKKDSGGKLKTDPQGDLYDRWSQAVASSKELAEKACSFASETGCSIYRSFVMPLVVVPNGTLLTAAYNAAGTIIGDPTLVGQCTFSIAAPLHLKSGCILILTHIHFVTLDGLCELLRSFIPNKPSRIWNKIFPESAKSL